MAESYDISDSGALLSLKEIKLWSTNALKVYLRVRNKDTDGDFAELAAR